MCISMWAVLIAFVTEATQISDARAAAVHIKPDWHLAEQPAPDYCVNQRISW